MAALKTGFTVFLGVLSKIPRQHIFGSDNSEFTPLLGSYSKYRERDVNLTGEKIDKRPNINTDLVDGIRERVTFYWGRGCRVLLQ